jgi:hypothetical protein
MNGVTDTLAIQFDLEWYLKQNYHGRIDAMDRKSAEDGTLRLLLFRNAVQSVLVLTKKYRLYISQRLARNTIRPPAATYANQRSLYPCQKPFSGSTRLAAAVIHPY